MTPPRTPSPDPLAFTNGTLLAAPETARVCVWGEPGGGRRLLVIGPRHLIADATLHILLDEDRTFFPFRPGAGLDAGDPLDLVFASTPPLRAKARILVKVKQGETLPVLGTYHTHDDRLVANEVSSWRMENGFPLAASDADRATRQREALALLENFKAMKNDWPRLRPPSIATTRDVDLPLPAMELRRRVQGSAASGDPDGSRFLEYGHEQLDLVLRIAEVYGARLADHTTTLDWGVGCARMARHLPPPLRRGFTGIDVDPVNIAWCREHIPFGRYVTIDPFSRTGLDEASFDLIYSHSVLTHLGEADQFHWLGELGRLSRGLIILSVSGLFALHLAGWARDLRELSDHLERGFRNAVQVLPDIQDVTPRDYYRMIAHTPAYIRANWSRYVQVVDIIPGGFGTRHDAVVCRPLDRG